MLVTPYMSNTSYLVQKSPKLKLASLASFIYFSIKFYLSAKKPVNLFFESYFIKNHKYNALTFRHIIPKLNENQRCFLRLGG